jgi:uncharacterized protein
MSAYVFSVAGGALIGLSAAFLLIVNGRIAGISGIAGRLAQGAHLSTNASFVAGLVAGPLLVTWLSGAAPSATPVASMPVLAFSGLLVGFGSRMGSGCTSGHGVVGLARLSPRSFAATAAFLGAGIGAATLMRIFG